MNVSGKIIQQVKINRKLRINLNLRNSVNFVGNTRHIVKASEIGQ